MLRPLRIEFPDACYHVICRGNARLPIFADDADKGLLLDRMVLARAIFTGETRTASGVGIVGVSGQRAHYDATAAD